MHPDHRGQGVPRRALQTIVTWAFSELGARTISTHVHVGNLASQKAFAAAGFARTATTPSKTGDHDDHVYVYVRAAPLESPARA